MTFILPVKHLKQQSNWDCGITCLRMLIDYYHLDLSSFEYLLSSYECNESTWTIDLLHLLHQLNIHAILYTITIGCSSTYNNTPYYQTLIDKDRERVDKLFIKESSNVKLGSIDWLDLKKHLIEQRTPCLVLIDANKLECCTCKTTIFHQLIDKLVSKIPSSYQGHYILVIGYITNENNDFIRYVDPGRNDEFCTTTKENFDLARKAFGTDEDIILCYKKDTI
ncbi:unnamed protein product [Rotaria sordida]|uniref:Guanylyl cyclase n=1 Tax=Rotaria sordida TaxID=392033 RepID=A0A813Z3D2_9BILA|nr:unnamed protein product [Rotaria sordida]CAF3750319.1 unnamed protein product [Rotaria sordida]